MTDNSSELSDDILVAFADSELPEEEMIRLKPLIEADDEATKKVEEYQRSADQIREYFSVSTPAVTPPEIAQKIREMGSPLTASDNVVSLATYRQRLSRGVRSLSSGAGLQKIAASLIIGVFVGIAGTSQYDYDGLTGINEGLELKVRGVPSTVPLEADGLVLKSASGTFRSGSMISNGKYRIHLNASGADKVSLIYHEKNDAPAFLLEETLIGSAKVVQVPTDKKKAIEIDTDASFVTFERRMQLQGRDTRRFYVFGIE